MEVHFNFNLRSASSSETSLLLVCRAGTHVVKVSTQQVIKTEVWDSKKQRCYTSAEKFSDAVNTHSKEVNRVLNDISKRLSEVVKDGIDDDKTTFAYLKELMVSIVANVLGIVKTEKKKQGITPLQFFATYVTNRKIDPRTGRYISERTKVHLRTVLKRFEEFFKDCNIADDWSIFRSKSFDAKYMNWCFNVKGYKLNTVYASYGVLKPWLNAAKAEGYNVGDDYRHLKSKGIDVDAVYLTEDEIDKIYRLDIPSLIASGFVDAKSTMENTRDLFVVGCWTGLRRSDLSRLNEAHFDLAQNTITITAEKTKRKVVIPMHPMVLALYQKYNGKFPQLASKSHAIDHIRECARLAGICDVIPIVENIAGKIITRKFKKYQLVGMHTGRRSFATNLYKRKIVPTIAIMQLTGHTTEANFLKYIKVTQEENAEMMNLKFAELFCS